MKHGTRARTHMELRLLEQRSCLGQLIVAAICGYAWLHPLADPPYPHGAAAVTDCTAAALTTPAYADSGYDVEADIYWREVDPASLDSIGTLPAGLVTYLAQHDAPAGTAELLLTGIDIAQRAGYDTPDPLLLACIARPESHFDDAAVGSAGERGLLQVHPCHQRGMQRLGWDFTDGADRVAYACVLWDSSGLRPWSTRRAAQRDYNTWRMK